MQFIGEVDHLDDEHIVFIECVRDILAVTPGARWHLVTDPEQLQRCKSPAFAVFIIETHPALDMTVSLELGEKSFVIIVNGVTFRQRRKSDMSFDRWIDRNCRVVTRMTEGELRLTTQRLAGTPQRATLSVRRGGEWHELCKNESHPASIMGYLLPFGIGLALSSEQTTEFPDWADAQGVTVTNPSEGPSDSGDSGDSAVA